MSDTEHTRNKDFKKTQLAKRHLVASGLAKVESIEKELKYADRVPTRVPGGVVRDNLRNSNSSVVVPRNYVGRPTSQNTAENNVAQASEEPGQMSIFFKKILGTLMHVQAGVKHTRDVAHANNISVWPFDGPSKPVAKTQPAKGKPKSGQVSRTPRTPRTPRAPARERKT